MRIEVNPTIWQSIKQQAKIWRTGALPGLVVMGCVALTRLTGAMQPLEWMAFDATLRSRPIEIQDPRIVIVGINEADIRARGSYPISNRDLAKLLSIIKQYQPRAIGLDIFRDLTNTPDRAELAQVFKDTPYLIGIETALSADAVLKVKPPPELPLDRVGLADAILDPDGKLRRSLLASRVDSGAIRYSFPLLVAQTYLKSQGIRVTHGDRATAPIRISQLELPRFRSNTGAYVAAKAGGNQILLNFRSSPTPFLTLSLTDFLSGKVKPEWVRNRVVLIGMTAVSVNDTFSTSALQGTLLANRLGNPSANQYQLIYGVEIQAHAASQILSAALDGRPLLRSWVDEAEYVWILLWGLGGITIGLILQSPWKTLLSLAVLTAILLLTCYGLLLSGWWVPLVPTLLTLWGAGLTTAFFDQRSKKLLEQRSLILKRTYDAVHNGPLQTLAAILRGLGEEAVPADKLRSQLQTLNRELRSVYESMNQALQPDSLYHNTPIQELLYQVYDSTLQRDLPGFSAIKTFIPPDFSALETCPLSSEQKQALCLFLEEALCNVGKHAVDANCLDVICSREKNTYILRVIDDGSGSSAIGEHLSGGRGTDQARELARHLRGRFRRKPHSPQGVVCELVWTAKRHFW